MRGLDVQHDNTKNEDNDKGLRVVPPLAASGHRNRSKMKRRDRLELPPCRTRYHSEEDDENICDRRVIVSLSSWWDSFILE